MKKRVDLAQIFPNYVFWDADLSGLDVWRDRGLIIPRALFATDENNFEENMIRLEQLYSRETILSVLQHTTELISNKVCEMVAIRYDVDQFYRFDPKKR